MIIQGLQTAIAGICEHGIKQTTSRHRKIASRSAPMRTATDYFWSDSEEDLEEDSE
jgi:hypothetical protein